VCDAHDGMVSFHVTQKGGKGQLVPIEA
jgi:hypothetical protein